MMRADALNVELAEETAADAAGIRRLVEAAFGGADEAELVERLRADGDLLLGLVARSGEDIAGYVAFSRMRPGFVTAAPIVGLAPLAVLPQLQRRGIGQALVCAGLERLRNDGCAAVFVLGEPGYYERFGFSAEAAEGLEVQWPGPAFQGRWLDGSACPSGRLDYAPAFDMFL